MVKCGACPAMEKRGYLLDDIIDYIALTGIGNGVFFAPHSALARKSELITSCVLGERGMHTPISNSSCLGHSLCVHFLLFRVLLSRAVQEERLNHQRCLDPDPCLAPSSYSLGTRLLLERCAAAGGTYCKCKRTSSARK